jgi:predicted ATPase
VVALWALDAALVLRDGTVTELAATWVNVLSCAAIVHELEQTLEILATRRRTVPERHRSMHAVFDHSWQLLNKVDQDTLLGLAIFRGSFPRAAAEQVAGATLPILAARQDKSFVRYNADEQYSLHELLRQYLNELLARQPELLADYQRRHSDYWLHFLEQVLRLALDRPGATVR